MYNVYIGNFPISKTDMEE